MPQLHLYVPNVVADAVRRRAEAAGVSISQYLNQLVLRDVGNGWPEGWFGDVVGGWKGDPIERPTPGSYELRDELD